MALHEDDGAESGGEKRKLHRAVIEVESLSSYLSFCAAECSCVAKSGAFFFLEGALWDCRYDKTLVECIARLRGQVKEIVYVVAEFDVWFALACERPLRPGCV